MILEKGSWKINTKMTMTVFAKGTTRSSLVSYLKPSMYLVLELKLPVLMHFQYILYRPIMAK
jgi:hypothetical protein